MRPDLTEILKELSALSDADRKAILKRLSSSERKALQKARREEHIHPNLRALSACSPRLARQLAPIAQSEAGSRRLGVSEAARQALLNTLGSPNAASGQNGGAARDGWERAS